MKANDQSIYYINLRKTHLFAKNIRHNVLMINNILQPI